MKENKDWIDFHKSFWALCLNIIEPCCFFFINLSLTQFIVWMQIGHESIVSPKTEHLLIIKALYHMLNSLMDIERSLPLSILT